MFRRQQPEPIQTITFTVWELWESPVALAWLGMKLNQFYGQTDHKGAAIINQ